MDDLFDQTVNSIYNSGDSAASAAGASGLTIGNDTFTIQRTGIVEPSVAPQPAALPTPLPTALPTPPPAPLPAPTTMMWDSWGTPPAPETTFTAPNPMPAYTIPPPEESSLSGAKRARDDSSGGGEPATKRATVDVSSYVPTYEQISPESVMRGDRELDIMEYRDEMKEWQQSGTLQLPFDVDQLGEEDLLREYRKYSTLMENRDVSEFIVESAENAMTTLEQYGPSYQQDFSGLSFKFSEEKAKFKQLTTKLVRRNLKHVRLPVWLQIGMMCVGMIGGVWMSNYYGRAMMQEAPPEAALPAYDMPPQQPQQAPPRNNRADWNAARRRTM